MLSTSQRIIFRARQREDNVAGLETDVMRFMAIFAFCLMAIFALVNSTDFKNASMTEVEEQNTQSQVLEKKIVEQEKLIQAQLAKLETAKLVIDTLQTTNIKLNNQINDVKHKKPKPTRKQHTTKTQTENSKPVVVKKTTRAPTKFTLSFNSDNDLIALLNNDTVKLFATKGNKTFQAKITHRNIKFNRANLAGRYYPMSTDTVPNSLVSKLPNNLEKAQWHVALPNSMVSKIQSLMQKNSGGEILIKSNADVVLL